MKKNVVQTSFQLFFTLSILCSFTSCSLRDDIVIPQSPDEVNKIFLPPTRTYDEALAIAENSIKIIEGADTRQAVSRKICKDGSQCVTCLSTRGTTNDIDTLMYVFNFEDNAGFSLVAANRAISPLLGVAEKGNYTYGEKTGADNFDFYMEKLVDNLQGIKPPPFDTLLTGPKFKNVEINEHSECPPLVSVNWNQNGVFGAYCGNRIAGCTAVAFAQIMSYYEYPNTFSTTYTGAPHAGETISIDWTSVKSNPYTFQVSALLREIGERFIMDYSDSTSSGASPSDVPKGIRTFGYNCPLTYTSFSSEPIRTLLDNCRPVYVRGNESAKGRGHAWVADGYEYSRTGTEYYEWRVIDELFGKPIYDYVLVNSTVVTTDLLHFNWGWGKSYNGYYTAIDSRSAGGYTFQNNKMQFINCITLN